MTDDYIGSVFRSSEKKKRKSGQSGSAASGGEAKKRHSDYVGTLSHILNHTQRGYSSGEYHEFHEERCVICKKLVGKRNIGVFHTCPACVKKNYGY